MRAYPSHRRVLAVVAAAVAVALMPASTASAKSFTFGVAAGEVTRESAILWTRADSVGDVTLRITSPPTRSVRVFELEATSSNDRTVQKRVTGLRPGTTYLYRFFQEGRSSVTGRFTTAPPTNANRTIRFAFSGDADAQRAKGEKNIFYDDFPDNNGFSAESFGIYKRMTEEGNDFNVNLGDTIYSDTEVREAQVPIARSVSAKWAKYRQNLAVPNLQTLRASGGVYSHWDDHEFINDFTKAENGSTIYNAGVRAFRDYMPVHYTEDDGLYNRQRWGKNLDVFRLDLRSFRSAKASANHTCDNPETHQPDVAPTAPQSNRNVFALLIPSLGQPVSQRCKDRINDPRRTMLGKRQFDRFVDAVAKSTATFKVIFNEVGIQQYYAFPYDEWEGYEAERKRLLHALENRGVKNLVFLTTDIHAVFVNVVRYRTLESGGPKDSPYNEFVTGPVSTKSFQREIDENAGSGAGSAADTAFFSPPPPTGVGMKCSNVNIYSYSQVVVSPTVLTVTAKDVHGQVVRDQSDGVTPCVLAIPRQ